MPSITDVHTDTLLRLIYRDWNLLPASCINYSSTSTFKNHLSPELELEAVKFKVSQL